MQRTCGHANPVRPPHGARVRQSRGLGDSLRRVGCRVSARALSTARGQNRDPILSKDMALQSMRNAVTSALAIAVLVACVILLLRLETRVSDLEMQNLHGRLEEISARVPTAPAQVTPPSNPPPSPVPSSSPQSCDRNDGGEVGEVPRSPDPPPSREASHRQSEENEALTSPDFSES